MIEKVLYFLVLICSAKSDLTGDAQEQLNNLALVINGTRIATEYQLAEEFLVLKNWGTDMDNKAQSLILTQKEKIEENLATLNSLAEEAGVDISPCLVDSLNYLESLPDYIDNILKICIRDWTDNANKTVEKSDALIDLLYDNVADIGTQISLCKSDACFAPIIDFIGDQEVELPQKINVEATRVEGLFDLLKVAIDECQQITVAEYAFSTTYTVNAIEDCANSIIG